MDLLGTSSCDEEDADLNFKINKGYAKKYDKWRKQEEKQRLLAKYGEQESTDSSEEEEIRSTPQMDKDWLRAYAVVRFKQPRLYKEGEKFFKDTAKPVSKKKEKATTLKDHERKFILEKGGIDEDSKPKPLVGKSYFEEQEEIKQSLKEAIGDSSDNESAEEEDLLVKAHKTEKQKEEEENEYLEWLKGERQSLGDPDAEAELAPLKEYWNDPSLDEKEKVLRDYILNNGYMDQEDSDSDSDDDDDEDGGVKLKDMTDRDEEELFLEEAEKYEHKYNFRHEEPGGDEIKSYPRVIETSVRTKDTRRAEKRKQKHERKRKEKEKMKDEIRLLQKLQMEEKMEKLDKLREIAHRPDLDYDLDADFDPDEHNQIMKKYFDDDYYEDEDDDQKPKFDYDAAIDEEEDEWWKERLQEEEEEAYEAKDSTEDNEQGTHEDGEDEEEGESYGDDTNFIMDADYDPTRDYKAEKKRAKKYGKALARKLPVFDPTTKTFDEYIDEYLKDKINDLPFTYRKVAPNDYGLTTEEILSLPDRELNAWVSVKKMSQHRTVREEREEQRRYQARARDTEKKKKILPSLFQEQEENPETHSKRKKKKKKRKVVEAEENADDEGDAPVHSDRLSDDAAPPPNKKLKKSNSSLPDPTIGETSAGSNVTSSHSVMVKRKKKRVDGEHREWNLDDAPASETILTKCEKKQKKKKRDSGETVSSVGNKSESAVQLESDSRIKSVKLKAKSTNHHSPETTSGKNPAQMMSNKLTESMSSSQAKDTDKTVNQLKKRKKKKEKKNGATQKSKKRKLSIKMNKKLAGDAESAPDTKNLKHQLSKIMSASRLSKYGLGPNASKEAKKKNNKKKNRLR